MKYILATFYLHGSLLNSTPFFLQDMEDYLKGCRFLPKLNNEIPNERNATYKERFSSLENLVLIMVGSTRPG